MQPSPEVLADLKSWDVLVGRVKGRWDHANLRVVPFSDVEGRFSAGAKLCAEKDGVRRLLSVRESKPKDRGWVCDCDLRTSEEAEALIGAQLFVHRSMRPALPDDEFYPDELIGMRVQTEEGADWGEVEELLEMPQHDVLVTPRALIPNVDEFVVSKNKAEKRIVVRDVPGLLNDSSDE
jgi:16S rRNA processing protein RimM